MQQPLSAGNVVNFHYVSKNYITCSSNINQQCKPCGACFDEFEGQARKRLEVENEGFIQATAAHGGIERRQMKGTTCRDSAGIASMASTCIQHEKDRQSLLLEQLYVHGVYEKLAPEFEHEQYRPCSDVKDFLMELEAGSLVADIGCGNGHYLNVNPDITILGVDRSANLLNSASERASGVTCRADCLALPYKDNTFDAVLFIGVIHHLVTSQRQAKALRELARILRPNGRILLYAWAWEQEKRKFKGQNVLVPRQVSADCGLIDHQMCSCWPRQSENTSADFTVSTKLRRMLSQTMISRLWNRPSSLESCGSSSSTDSLQSSDNDEVLTGEDSSDDVIEIPEEFKVREFPASSLFSTSTASTRSEVTVHRRECATHSMNQSAQSRDDRFYHVFKKGELEKLINNNVGNLQVIKSIYKSGHWCVTIRKTL